MVKIYGIGQAQINGGIYWGTRNCGMGPTLSGLTTDVGQYQASIVHAYAYRIICKQTYMGWNEASYRNGGLMGMYRGYN
jgi:hypothetical protein